MAYTYANQKKALEYLIEHEPHEMEKFRKLNEVGNHKVKINLVDILFSEVWTTEEKVQLIQLYEHDKSEEFCYKDYSDEYYAGIEGLPLIDQCIRHHSFSGVQALLKTGNHISVATIACIVKYIKDPEERYAYCKLIVDHHKDNDTIQAYEGTGNQCYLIEIPSLCDRYPAYTGLFHDSFWGTFCPMKEICSTNDLELVKLFLPTIKNINPLLSFAVESGKTEMVDLYIKEKGADVNFQDLEFSEKEYTNTASKIPLKIAIDRNDLKMISFLDKNGADLNFVDKSEKVQELIRNLGKKKAEKETHQYKDLQDRKNYMIWTDTPLEYAIHTGLASITGENMNKTGGLESYEKQFRDRLEIVRYLYENGAAFKDGKVNYTDLICFAIKSDSYSETRYYFEEALKHNSQVDFEKIISFLHTPGIIEEPSWINLCRSSYKRFEEGATPWFQLCEKYSKKLDLENHSRNLKRMLEKIFQSFYYPDYKDFVIRFSKELQQEDLKTIPAVFGVRFDDLEEVLDLGYDINCIDKDGNSILMDYAAMKNVTIEMIDKLVSLGADPSHQNPKTGKNALSLMIPKLPKVDFGNYIGICNGETHELNHAPEEYETTKKSLVKRMIELSSQEIVRSESVKHNVCRIIEPGYPQIIYNEILEALSKKGFKVDDEYFTESITFLDDEYAKTWVTKPWIYLWNLYSNFDNQSIETHLEFPKIEEAKKFKYGTEESNLVLDIVREHLNRNFVTTKEQIENPEEIIGKTYHPNLQKHVSKTALQEAQNELLDEIKQYIGNLDYRQIITLIDSFPMIDVDAMNRNGILAKALDCEDRKLCRELIKRGVTIACYDENGHDVTTQQYGTRRTELFSSLNRAYNPNSEYEDLLAEIGCKNKVKAKEYPNQEAKS